jgi:hypothetical protein
MIEKCALAIITERGRSVIAPTWSTPDEDEASFLSRHVERLRTGAATTEKRGRFRSGSTLSSDIQQAIVADRHLFIAIADRLVRQLATGMQSVNTPPTCVVAFLVERSAVGHTVSLLKLDAEIEAARLAQTRDGIRLEVFQDLLPQPGAIQKGFSWPDPRSPHSELIILDANVAGTAMYFQNAYRIDASPTASQTEAALTHELSVLPPSSVAVAVAAAQDGGAADVVVQRIRAQLPNFSVGSPELGAADSLPGVIRPQFTTVARHSYKADGIELKVPLTQMGRVVTRRSNFGYETVITTTTPLTPLGGDDVGGAV